MISAKEFNQLSMMKQTQVLLDRGREMMLRHEGDYMVRLYSLEDFFVEAWYHPLVNRLVRVEVVNIDDVSFLYEPDIDISDLFY